MSTRKTALAITAAAALLAGTLANTAMAQPAASTAPAATRHDRPTVVLLHGAFEDATAWSGVTRRLTAFGYRVVAPAVPLRGVASDTTYLDSVLKTVQGPKVLVGHSYGGVLVSALAAKRPEVVAAVYVAAFIPEGGETVGDLNSQFPGSLLGPDTSYTVPYPGGTDLYVKPESYRTLLAGDRTRLDAAVAAAQQRPLDTRALTETITQAAPADIPKYAIVATRDKAVPPAAQQWQAERAHAHIRRVASAHDVPASHPGLVTHVIAQAVRDVCESR